jgi:hypothetical protein
MIERLPAASRQHHYHVIPGGFTRVLNVQLTRMRSGVDAAEFGLSLLGNSGSGWKTSGTSVNSSLMTTATS